MNNSKRHTYFSIQHTVIQIDLKKILLTTETSFTNVFMKTKKVINKKLYKNIKSGNVFQV